MLLLSNSVCLFFEYLLIAHVVQRYDPLLIGVSTTAEANQLAVVAKAATAASSFMITTTTSIGSIVVIVTTLLLLLFYYVVVVHDGLTFNLIIVAQS